MTIYESNTAHLHLNKSVLGFSGYSHNKLRRKYILGSPYLIRIRSEKQIILVYYNPAVDEFHIPQDAIGIIKLDSLLFGLADGVTIVKGAKNNHSAMLSYACINQLKNLKSSLWNKEIDMIASKFATPHFVGASTCIWGRIHQSQLTTKLKILFVGNPLDMGMSYLFTPDGKLNLKNQSAGFLPSNYTIDSSEVFLPPIYSLVFSTDGIELDTTTLNGIFNNLNHLSFEETLMLLKEQVKPNQDDQSMFMVHQFA